MIEEKVKQFAAQYDMFPEGTRVLCACSGGADSVSLLSLLRGMKGIETVCAHFNHGLRGAESDRDEAFVRALCEGLGIPCVTERGDVSGFAARKGFGTEEAARILRYGFLERTAARQHCGRIATAHNAEDNAETVLMNLVRGSGAKGLSGIPPVRGIIVRPLLTVTRSEIEAYLEAAGLQHIEDSTNASDDYARNRIRHHVLPLLREQNPAAVENIGTAASLVRQDDEYLTEEAEQFLSGFAQDSGIPVEGFLSLARPVGARVLRLMCPGIQKKHIDSVYSLCMEKRPRWETDVPGARLVAERGMLRVNPEEPDELAEKELRIGGETVIPEAGLRILCSYADGNEEIHNSFNIFYFKNESICGRIHIASRKNGDCIRLLGRGCTKSLKKLFSEAGMTAAQKRSVPVISDELGVIAVPGFGIAERCAPDGTGSIRIEIQKIADKEENDDVG